MFYFQGTSNCKFEILYLLVNGRSTRCNFSPWDKGQCPHGTLFHAVPGCCKCFQQCRVAGTARVGILGSYPTLLEAFATPWDSVEQCSMGTLSLVPSSGTTLIKLLKFALYLNRIKLCEIALN